MPIKKDKIILTIIGVISSGFMYFLYRANALPAFFYMFNRFLSQDTTDGQDFIDAVMLYENITIITLIGTIIGNLYIIFFMKKKLMHAIGIQILLLLSLFLINAIFFINVAL